MSWFFSAGFFIFLALMLPFIFADVLFKRAERRARYGRDRLAKDLERTGFQ
jgi:hypothetical protein